MHRQPIKKYDLYNENFEFWFRDLLKDMSYAQRSRLPDDLLMKLERYIAGGTHHFEFRESLYILTVALDKQVTIVIQDDNEGISAQDMAVAHKASLGRARNADLLGRRGVEANFVLADKNLFESLTYLNEMYTSDIYKIVKEIDFKSPTKIAANNAKGKEAVKGVSRLLLTWEMNKKKISQMFRLTPSMIYALLYFETMRYGVNFYMGDFKYSYNANKKDMQEGLIYLHRNKYLIRTGLKGKFKYHLSAYGIDIRDKIFTTLINLNKL